MLKRNLVESHVNPNESHCEGEPQAKRSNFASQFVTNVSHCDQNENVKIPPPNFQNPTKSNLHVGLLKKKPIDKSQFFDCVLEYFEKTPGVDSGGSSKKNIDVMKPVIIDLDADDSPHLESNADPNVAKLPQILLNPKAPLNTPTLLKTSPDIPIPVQTLKCYSGPKGNRGVRNSTPNSGKISPSKEVSKTEPETDNSLSIPSSQMQQSECSTPNSGKISPSKKVSKTEPETDNSLSITFSQMRQSECCIIDNLIKRFQNLNVKPLPENELDLFIEYGRPTPEIPSLEVSVNLYDHHLWIAGCPTLGGLYCWICLLFSSKLLKTQNSVWVREGFRAMNTLGISMTKHINCRAHREAISIKNLMIQNRVILNFMPDEDFVQSSTDSKAGISLPATKNVSTTANNQSITVQKEASDSLPLTVSSTTNSQSIDVQNKASYALPATEPVLTKSNKPINIRKSRHKHVLKPKNQRNQRKKESKKQSKKIPNTKNHVQISQLGSTTGLNVTNNKLKERNSVIPPADKSGENSGAPQPQTPQPEMSDLMDSGNYERSSPETKALSKTNGSSKQTLAQFLIISPLRKELETKALTPQPSVNNQTQLPGNSSPTYPADTIKRPLSLHVVDLAILQARLFPDGTFNGSENLRELIITTGRPTPEMPGLTQEVNGVVEHFNVSLYDKFPWMCGSAETKRLYCWPCFMLTDHQHPSFWNTVGYNDLANLTSLAKSHSINQTHLELSINLKMMESSAKNKYQKTKTDRVKHNEIVRHKRSLMKYLTDAVCFKKTLLNNAEICHDDFNDFLKILSNYDIKLKTLLDPESPKYIADFTPNFISNYSRDITKALKTILRKNIAKELEYSVYVSFILKTIKNKCIAFILRYTKSTGEVLERFYKFLRIGFELQGDLLKKIVTEVYKLKCSDKFVGISYDGGVLRPDQMESFNSNLRNELFGAHFFHYRDDNFQALLQQSLSLTPFCRSFFHLVTEFGNFLQENPSVKTFVRRLECEMSLEKPEDWDLKSGIIITIRDHYLAIMKFLDQVVNRSLSPETWTNQVVSQCSKFLMFLGLIETRLFLVFFSKIYVTLHPIIEAFHGEFDAKYWKTATDEAYSAVMDVQTNSCLSLVCQEAEEMVGHAVESLPKSEQSKLSTMYNNTIDYILTFIKYRTKYIDIWSYFDFSNMKIDSQVAKAQLNQAQFQMRLREYFPFFDSQKLASALIFAHNHEQFRNKSAVEIIQVMNEFNFKSVLPELYSFLLLIQTVPQSSANVSRPASDRITSFVEGKTHLKSSDALLHLEKDLLSSVRNEKTFYNDVLKIISELKSTNEFTEIDEEN